MEIGEYRLTTCKFLFDKEETFNGNIEHKTNYSRANLAHTEININL